MNRFVMIFVIVVVFAAVMLAMQGWYWYRITRQQQEEKELARRLGTLQQDNSASLFRLKQKKDGPNSLGDIGGRIALSLDQLLLEAGNPMTFQALVGRMVVAALVGIVALSVITTPVVGLGGILLAYIPIMMVRSKATKRGQEITEQLPDALELVARSLQAGHGIAEAMRSCAEEMKPPVSMEFGLVYEQNNLGRDFRECMQGLIERNPTNFDLKIFASSVLLQRETGGNLIEILESIANVIRKRFVFHGKVKALTAEAKFSAIILGALPWFVTGAIYALRPEYLNPLFDDPLGNLMLGFVVIWFTLGFFVMRELMKVDV
ncbi:MAG: hypothetical protein GY913_31310 [Proteobacteria bacterium]|nr:hypothetical protein [Pseudomonadota bacterium]MCP4921408.1 hypothetical protein [Pseudomonadota bacterium]